MSGESPGRNPSLAVNSALLHDDQSDLDGAERRQFQVRRDVRKRLDVYLQGRLRGISRSRVQKLVEAGGVTVNGLLPKASTIIHCGDYIDVILPPPAIRIIEPEPIPLSILHEDDTFIVINKQADLIVHPARSNLNGTLVNALAHHFKQAMEQSGKSWLPWQTRGFKRQRDKDNKVPGLSNIGAEELRPGIIHRLDKHTTGVMVVAKREDVHWGIARQFEDRKVLKGYLAVVHGGPDDAAGVIDQPIGKHPTYREPYAVRHDRVGKPSVTIYRVRERYAGYTLMELELKTGRTHQIRVHLSYMGWPIVGDIFYGGEPVGHYELDNPPAASGSRQYLNFARDKQQGDRVEAEAASRDDLIIARPALHAGILGFVHPVTGERMEFTAPVHEPMGLLLRELGKRRIEGPTAKNGTHIDLDKITAQTT